MIELHCPCGSGCPPTVEHTCGELACRVCAEDPAGCHHCHTPQHEWCPCGSGHVANTERCLLCDLHESCDVCIQCQNCDDLQRHDPGRYHRWAARRQLEGGS
jgi:hypothetical protein